MVIHKKSKKLIFGALVILSVISIIYLFGMQGKSKRDIGEINISDPQIPILYEGEVKYTLNIEEQKFKFPASIPVLTSDKTPSFTEDDAKQFASNFGYDFSPTITNDYFEGKTYIWISDIGSLFVFSDSNRVSYSSTNPLETINKQLSDKAIIATAENFVNEKFGIPKSEFQFGNIIYYEGSTAKQGLFPTTKNNADIYHVNFNSAVSDLPILTLNPDNSPLYVRVLPDGEVYQAEYIKTHSLQESSETFKLKGFDEIQNSIDQAVLITLDDGNLNIADLPKNSIKVININTIDLAYLFDSSKSQIYQPVYLLGGSALIENAKDKISAQLYLPAISSN